ANHAQMVHDRAAKIAGIVQDIDDLTVDDPSGRADVLVIGWGSTFGPITAAVRRVRDRGDAIAQAHLRHINPFPANLGEVLHRYRRVVLPEMNTGQLAMLLRSRFLVDVRSVTRVRGIPISPVDLCEVLCGYCEETTGATPAAPQGTSTSDITSKEAR
ncbi:MAG: 2-oxoglutarate ferredoxin oxidoreductase subunit alpha, partial [Acidipropionibacterium jensenii]|nr:2-oxoglutarate ferredoxin oxidoreductase subunit alpha [Acidipropionibacterium jensenii]